MFQATHCANLRGMTVVSHKTNLVGERSAPPDAAALRELARAKIRAVDLDLMPSLDGTFWACHPAELQQATGAADAFAVTDAAVLASNPSMLPLPQLLTTSASLNISLMLELKGAERPLYAKHFVRLIRQVGRYWTLKRPLFLWVPSRSAAVAVLDRIAGTQHDVTNPIARVRFIKPLYDRAAPRGPTGLPECEGQVQPGDEALLALGPSIHCITPAFLESNLIKPWTARGHRRAPSAGSAAELRELAAWSADTPSDLSRLALGGVTHVITNFPKRLRNHLNVLLRECDREIRVV